MLRRSGIVSRGGRVGVVRDGLSASTAVGGLVVGEVDVTCAVVGVSSTVSGLVCWRVARDPLEGKFVSVVASPTSEPAALEARDDLEREYGLQFGILLSSDYRSLNAGYWVVYLGPFDTAKESQNACWWDLNMEEASLCYGRCLSQNPADREVSYAPSNR